VIKSRRVRWLGLVALFRCVRNVVGNDKVVPAQTMNEYGKVNIRLQTFLTSVLNGDEWSTLRSVRFTRPSQKKNPFPFE